MVDGTLSYTYMATCVPGGEGILTGELMQRLPEAACIRQERGKVFFNLPREPELPWPLRCADNVYRVLGCFPVGPHKADLDALESALAQFDCRTPARGRGRRAIVSASRAGKHTYSRYDLAARAAKVLERQGFLPVSDEKGHDVAFRLDVREESAVFSMQLTPAQFRFRGEAFQSSRGGIRPTVAHLLVRLSEPRPEDVFCDPFCGAGTIPFERAAYPCSRLIAGDLDPKALDAARQNLQGAAAELLLADAACLPLQDESVDAVVTNLPWGKQIQVEDLPQLYRDFAGELRRILRPEGRAILFTDQDAVLLQACRGAGLRAEPVLQLSLHGLHPCAYAVGR